jgi:lauroyl/myristoyl acyltransferase
VSRFDPRRGAIAVLRVMPLWLANALAWTLAWGWWWILPIRRAEAVANLAASVPEAPVRATLVRMMRDLVLGYVELFQFHRLQITVEGAEGIRGSVVIAGHGGAWDIALLAWADAFPLAIFLRTPKDPFVAALLAELRDAHGLVRLETGATMADAYVQLAAGRNVYFIQDQRHNKGPAVDFLGRPARTSLGAAVASLKTGRPVYGAWQWREGVGRHHLRIEPLPVEGTAEERTAAMNAFYSRCIRERPHGWLWLHRRWK